MNDRWRAADHAEAVSVARCLRLLEVGGIILRLVAKQAAGVGDVKQRVSIGRNAIENPKPEVRSQAEFHQLHQIPMAEPQLVQSGLPSGMVIGQNRTDPKAN